MREGAAPEGRGTESREPSSPGVIGRRHRGGGGWRWIAPRRAGAILLWISALAAACDPVSAGNDGGCDESLDASACSTSGSAKAGEPCDGNSDCASGVCDYDTMACLPALPKGACQFNSDCASGVCVPGKDLGTCGPAVDGTDCSIDAECISRICAYANNLGSCGAQPDYSYCQRDKDCISGLCDDTFGSAICLEPAGGPCDDVGQCGGYSLVCSQGKCVDPLFNGSPCQDNLQCAEGLCANGVCGPALADGSPCGKNDDCVDVLGCINGTCGPQVDGKACTSGLQCLSMTCRAGLCWSRLSDGASCSADTDCASGLCKNGACREHADNGAPCDLGTDCRSGQCNAGICQCVSPLGTPPQDQAGCCSGSEGELTGHYTSSYGAACDPSIARPCTPGQCDPGELCGPAGVCCIPQGAHDLTGGGLDCCSGLADGDLCTCVAAGAACQADAECCVGSCKEGSCQ